MESQSRAPNAWQTGQTGIPIIDAGMRQLLKTGWMHNRVRMITAMFLCKNLLIDWRVGEQWFMEHLIDGDLAANNGVGNGVLLLELMLYLTLEFLTLLLNQRNLIQMEIIFVNG